MVRIDESAKGVIAGKARADRGDTAASSIASRQAARQAAAVLSKAKAAEINQQSYSRMLFDRSTTTFEVQAAMR